MNVTLALRAVALLAAITATATGEWQLATHIGFDAFSAVAPVAATDAFAIAAFRSGRRWDVAFAVIAMAAGNAGGHIMAADGTTQGLWWVVVAVSSVAPLVAWRVHALQPAPVAKSAPKVVTQVAPRPVRATKPATSITAAAPKPVAIDRPSAEQAREITAKLVAANPKVTLAEIAKATQRDKGTASRLRKAVAS